MSLKFRYTLGAHDDAVKAFIREQCSGYLVIQHDADAEVERTHWHALLRGTKKIEALRLALKRLGIPPADYSLGTIREGEDEVYVRYMCHGSKRGDTVNVIMSHQLDYIPERLSELHVEFWRAREEFRKKAKGPMKNTVGQLVDACKAQSVDLTDVNAVALCLVDMYVEQSRPMSVYHMEAVVTAVYARTVEGRKDVARKIVDRIFR